MMCTTCTLISIQTYSNLDLYLDTNNIHEKKNVKINREFSNQRSNVYKTNFLFNLTFIFTSSKYRFPLTSIILPTPQFITRFDDD